MGEGRDRALVDLVVTWAAVLWVLNAEKDLLALEDMQKNIFMLATEKQKLIELGVKSKERHIFKSFNPCRLKIATLLLLNVHTELEKDSAVIDM